MLYRVHLNMSGIRPTLVVIGIDCTCGCTIRSRLRRHPYIQIFIIKPERLIHNQYLSSAIKMKITQYTSKTNILSLFYGLDLTFFVLNTTFNIITVLPSLQVSLVTESRYWKKTTPLLM